MSSLNVSTQQPHFQTTSIETTIKDKKQQHHQRSLQKNCMAVVKKSPAAIKQWKAYKISTDLNVMILTGTDVNTGNPAKIANLMRDKNQIISRCVAAISYSRIYLEECWKPGDIDKILDIGWNINRRASMKRPMNSEHQTKIGDITYVFYIDAIKFVTLTKASINSGTLSKCDCISLDTFSTALKEMVKESCIVEYNHNYFAVWPNGQQYFIFHPMSLNDTIPKCVFTPNFDGLQKYLLKIFVDPQTEYSFNSVSLLRINNQLLDQAEILHNKSNEQFKRLVEKSVTLSDESGVEANEISHKICLMPMPENASSYERISDLRDVLRCPNSVSLTEHISSTCIAAIVTLHLKRSSTWDSKTLVDILALGCEIYETNMKQEAHTEIQISDITSIIESELFQCLIDLQLIVVGKVEPSTSVEYSLEQGLIQFFKCHNIGVIDGPNIVAIWNDGKRYYMYDADARHHFGKMTKNREDGEHSGKSCVTRFQELSDLVEIYIGNVPEQQRHEYYKITNVEVKPVFGKNWYNWKIITPGQWCLRGNMDSFSESTFGLSIVGVWHAKYLTPEKWTPILLDGIADIAFDVCAEFKSTDIESAATKEPRKELKKQMEISGVKSILHINPNVFRYIVSKLSKNIENHLIQGFDLFFKTYNKGIFSFGSETTDRKYFSVWLADNHYYAFGNRIISDEGQNRDSSKKQILCALRFTNHIDLVKSLIADIVIQKWLEFSLSGVNVYVEEDDQIDHGQMKNFVPLQKGKSGILNIGTIFDLIQTYSVSNFAKTLHYTIYVLAFTQTKNCCMWSKYDVCDILRLAQRTFLALPDSKPVPDDYCITIGNITFQVEYGEDRSYTFPITQSDTNDNDQTSRIESENELLNEIQIFLNELNTGDYPYAIFTTNELQYGIWKENSLYFLFDQQGITENQLDNNCISDIQKTTNHSDDALISDNHKDSDDALISDNHKDSDDALITDYHTDSDDALISDNHKDSDDALISDNHKDSDDALLSDKQENINKQSDNDSQETKSISDTQETTKYQLDNDSDDTLISDEQEITNNQLDNDFQEIRGFYPYVAWFNGMKSLSEHILTKVVSAKSTNYVVYYLKFKTKIEQNEVSKSWYNFSLIDKTSNQWIIRSLYGSLHSNFDFATCVVSLAHASILQPFDWNSSTLDKILKNGKKLNNKSIQRDATITELKMCDILSTFMIGCYLFSFKSLLFKCGANEYHFLHSGIINLFRNSEYGIISSKGYNIAIWKQNDFYFMFNPYKKGAACLCRFSDTEMITKEFLSLLSHRMTGLNVFEIYKVSISRKNIKDRDCPVDIDAISKLTNQPLTMNKREYGAVRVLRSMCDDSTEWLEFEENFPKECYVIAACIKGNYKNPYLWTPDTIKEILRLGNTIFRWSIKKWKIQLVPQSTDLKPHQIQGLCPYDERNSVYIRMELFIKSPPTNTEMTLTDDLMSALFNLFKIWNDAFFTTDDVAITIWKRGASFHLFYCQAINEHGRLSKVGRIEAVVLTYNCLKDLYEFLMKNVGEEDGLKRFEIRHLEFTLVPSKCEENVFLNDNEMKKEKVNTILGLPCLCSQNIEEHKRKHPALCLAAIIMASNCNIKEWSSETLRQIETNGKELYEDELLGSKTKNFEFTLLRQTQKDIEMAEIKLHIEYDNVDYDMDEETLTDKLAKLFECSYTLCIMIDDTCLSLIANEGSFYTYDPNGIDKEKPLRPYVFHFSTLKDLICDILNVGTVLQCNKFSINFVKVSTAK